MIRAKPIVLAGASFNCMKTGRIDGSGPLVA